MFLSRTGIHHGIGQLGRVSSMGRDEGLHWNLLNGKIQVEMSSLAYINTFFSHMPPTSATATTKRTSRRPTQNIRRVFHHYTQPYRSSSRLKGCAIVDAEKHWQGFWVKIGDHSQCSFVTNLNGLPTTEYNFYSILFTTWILWNKDEG